MNEKSKEEEKQAEEISGEKVDKLAEARQIIIKEKQAREEECRKEVEAVLAKHNCRLMPNVNVVINGQQLGVSITAN